MATRIYAKNKTDLHRLIGISRPALERLFKRGDYPPQVPGQGWNIEQWKRYSRENIATWNQRQPQRNGNGHQPRSSILLLEEAKINRQNIQAEKEQFDLDVKRGRYGRNDKFYESALRNISATFRELDKAFRHELPPRLEGESAGKIARMLGEKLDALRERLTKSFSANGTS